ncbi:MAG: hypothetical protein NTX71_02295 [Candidatus Aureabacteria bacterium]|nr:hypothetical protein [Candidatus Auribacterota bacterium]
MDRKRLTSLFAICMVFNLAVGLIYPLRSFFFLRRFQLIRPDMTIAEANKLLERPGRSAKDGGIAFLVPLCFLDSDTSAVIYYDNGIVKKIKMPWDRSTAWGVLSMRLEPTALFVLILIAFVVLGNKYFSKRGGSLLASIAYIIVFGISLCNLLGILLIQSSNLAMKYPKP